MGQFETDPLPRSANSAHAQSPPADVDADAERPYGHGSGGSGGGGTSGALTSLGASSRSVRWAGSSHVVAKGQKLSIDRKSVV